MALRNKLDIQRRFIDCLDIEFLSWRECDNNLRQGGWQLPKSRLDDVRSRGTEWWGSFAREDRQHEWGILLTDENVGFTVVFDLKAGYAVHSFVKEPARQMNEYVNEQAIV